MIVRQIKSPAGRWFKIEALGGTYTVRPKGGRRGGPSESAYSTLQAAIDHVQRDRPR